MYWRAHKWTPFFRSGFMKTEYGGRIISPDLLATLVVGLAALIQYVLILPWHKNMLLTCSACPLGQWAFCKAHFTHLTPSLYGWMGLFHYRSRFYHWTSWDSCQLISSVCQGPKYIPRSLIHPSLVLDNGLRISLATDCQLDFFIADHNTLGLAVQVSSCIVHLPSSYPLGL